MLFFMTRNDLQKMIFSIGIILLGDSKAVHFKELLEVQAPAWEKKFFAHKRQEYWMTQSQTITAFINHLEQLITHAIDTPCTKGIPKIVHQIWIGGPVPNYLLPYQNSVKKLIEDGWLYLLWDDETLKSYHPINQQAFNAATNKGAQSDILRYELLYRYGGVYLDMDILLLNPKELNLLCEECDFFAGLEPLFLHCCVANAVIGACVAHPIMNYCITAINDNAQSPIHPLDVCLHTCSTTGAGLLSNAIWSISPLDRSYKTIIFPPYVFYPCTESGNKQPIEGSITTHGFLNSWFRAKPREHFGCTDLLNQYA